MIWWPLRFQITAACNLASLYHAASTAFGGTVQRQTDRVPVAGVEEHISPGAENSPLAAICVLRRESTLPLRFLCNAFHLAKPWRQCCHMPGPSLSQDAERKRRMINHYLELVAKVPVFEVSFPSGLENLPATLDAIETVLAESMQPA